MKWKLDDSMPIWIQLAEQIAQRIVSGVYPMGEKLPSVRELAADANVNPNTMQRALSKLDDDGLTETNRTSGRSVTASVEAINAERKKMAEQQMKRYLEGMAQIGFSNAEAKKMIELGEDEE